MYSDKLLLLKLDDIQEGLYRLDYNLNASDSLAISKLSDMSTSLSDIQNCIVAHSQNTFLGVSWDILLPALISLGIFILGVCINILYRRKQKQEGCKRRYRNLGRRKYTYFAEVHSFDKDAR